jgi:hypothetical protein
MEKEITKKKSNAGRPSKINSINLEQVKILYLSGWSDKQVSDFFDINEETLNAWKKKYPELAKSLKDWKKEADTKVERSLYERAIGYQHEEDKIFCENGKVTIVPTIHHYPPDATSMIFWLKNRQPEQWKDKADMEFGLKDNLIEKLKDLPISELLAKANAIIGKSTSKS